MKRRKEQRDLTEYEIKSACQRAIASGDILLPKPDELLVQRSDGTEVLVKKAVRCNRALGMQSCNLSLGHSGACRRV